MLYGRARRRLDCSARGRDDWVLATMIEKEWLPDGVGTGGYEAYRNVQTFYYRAAVLNRLLHAPERLDFWLTTDWVVKRCDRPKTKRRAAWSRSCARRRYLRESTVRRLPATLRRLTHRPRRPFSASAGLFLFSVSSTPLAPPLTVSSTPLAPPFSSWVPTPARSGS